MSFGALAAWQAWLIIAAAAVAATWLFRLKVRPPRVGVPSLVVWRRVFSASADPSWWERVRRAVSMAITAMVAVALAIAVARPGPRVSSTSRGRVLIVLDSSWSMRARTTGGVTRWERAVAEARALAESGGSDEIALATTADGLVEGPTSDAALIATALDRLAPAGGEGSAWPRVDGLAATHFFTDGAIERPLDPGTTVHSVYEPAPNVAITAFAARPPTSATSAPSAYLEIGNYAEAAQRAHLTVTRDTAIVIDRWLDLRPGEISRQVVPLDAGRGARLRAHVNAPADALDVDDEAVAWLRTADPMAVTVVSETPAAWSKLFEHDPNVVATFVRPSDYKPGAADVLVFDRWAPSTSPHRPALLLAPPLSATWLGTPGREEAMPRWGVSRRHPILDGVDLVTLDVSRARGFDSPALAPVASSETGTSLLSVLDSAAARAVVVSFGVADSNLASAPAFPVLVANALEWLARPAAGAARSSGPMELPASTTRVTSPEGSSVALVRAGDRVLVRLRSPGLYLVEAGGSRSVVGVNVGSPEVANLLRTSLPPAARRAGLGLSARPWWMYGVLVALVLLVAEWWTWQRRITV